MGSRGLHRLVQLRHHRRACLGVTRSPRSATWPRRRRSSTRRSSQVFTIFKEQRIEVPLARVSPHLRRAVIAIEDQRFYDHRGVDLVRVVAAALGQPPRGTAGAGRQHHYAAAGPPGVPQPRQDVPPQAEGSDPRGAHRARLLEGRDPRAVSEQGLLRGRAHGAEAAARGYFGKPAADARPSPRRRCSPG